MTKILALLLAFTFACSQAYAQTGWGQGYIPEFHQSDPNAPYILLPPYTPPNNGVGALTQYRTLIAQAPLDLTDNGPTMQLTLDLTKVPINLGGTNGTTQQEAADNVLGFTGVSLGDLAKYDGTHWVRFPKGSANQVLKMDGTGSDFAWTNQGSIINANAQFVVSASDGSMPNADVLTGGTGITVTNGTNLSTVAIDSTVATLAGSQILTNKTLTSPIFSWNGGAGVTLNSSGANTAAFTWADWLGARTITIPDPGTSSSTEVVLGRGTQTLNGTYTFANAPKLSTNTLTTSTGNTITFPNASDTVVTLTGTQQLDNKTLTAPKLANASSIVLQQTGGNYTLNWANPAAARIYTFYDANGNGDIAIKSGTPSAGSVAYGDGNLIQFSGVGTAGQALISAATSAPAFGTLDLRGGGVGITALANQSLMLGNGTNTVGTLAKGTANQILQMDGTGTSVGWRSPSFGTVTNVNVGDLSPLFTSSVANSSTAPSVSFSLTAASAGTIFGNFGSISGSPSYNLPGSSNQVLGVKSGGGLEYKTVTAGRNVNVVHSTGAITLKAANPATQGCRISLDKFNPVPAEANNYATYLVPYTNGRIDIYTSNNEWVEDVVDPLNPPSVTNPTTSGNYDVYVSDTAGSGTITMGTSVWPTLGTITQYTPTVTVAAMCTGPDGNIWFCGTKTSKAYIGKITPAGTITEYQLSASTSAGSAICVGPDGNFYVGDSATTIGNRTVFKVDTTGTVLNTYSNGGAATAGGIGGLCLGPDGNIWYTSTTVVNQRIGKMTTAGSYTEYNTAATGAAVNGICAGPDGRLWIAQSASNAILAVTTGGSITSYTTGISANNNPIAICAAPDGNLWFVGNGSANKYGKITTQGTVTEYALPTLAAGGYGICLGADGYIWFTERSVNKVGYSTLSGISADYTPAAGTSEAGICAGPDGYVWFGTDSTIKASKIATSGTPPTRGQQDGVWWTGNAQQRLVGCIRNNGSADGIIVDTAAQRFVYNWDNQVDAHLRGQQIGGSTWTYASTTLRNANANSTDGQGRVSFLLGRPTMTSAEYNCGFVATSTNASVGISLDGVNNTAQRAGLAQTGLGSYNGINATQQALVYPGVHFYQAVESCISAATVTFYANNPLLSTNASPYGLSSLLTVESKR